MRLSTGAVAATDFDVDVSAMATVEVRHSSGYRSQSTATQFVAIPERAMNVNVRVRWPDGDKWETAIGDEVIYLDVPHPSLETADDAG